jgi:sugar transferase EpsL
MSCGKRLFDLIIASLALIVVSPVLLVLAVSILLVDGPPVLFFQQRPGYKGRPFSIVKFRTLTAARDQTGRFLPDAQRMTSLGRFMRSWSLDELPELFNIIHGDMSMVGPRPLLMEYLPLYSPEQMRRHAVFPGLTGWAQVNGRNALDWPSRFKLDLWYVDHWSFGLDLWIILLTIWKTLSRQGINQPGSATTEYFTGEQD